MIVNFINQQRDLKVIRRSVVRLVEAFMQFHRAAIDEVALHFVTEKKICALHGQFFGDPSPTDCISFPLDEPGGAAPVFLGEVFVCPKTASKYAAQHQSDAYEELTLYVVHGLLHLLGYDDLEPRDRAAMRRAEKRFLSYAQKHHLFLT